MLFMMWISNKYTTLLWYYVLNVGSELHYFSTKLVWMVVHGLDELNGAKELHPPVLILSHQPTTVEIINKLNWKEKNIH